MKTGEGKIDFIITWLDDSDPEWQKSKNYYLNKDYGKNENLDDSIDVGENRYRDWGILRYWFRSVEKYAPWVNNIYFVTCGHVPKWLDLSSPKLHVIKHEDYIPDEYLPTFSSHPIELNFHRIRKLGEQFVYFNDDLFLTAPVEPKDFFVKGLPCDSLAEEPIEFSVRELYNRIRINDIIFANKHFDRKTTKKILWRKRYTLKSPHDSVKNVLMALLKNKSFFGLAIYHLPQAYLKKTLEEVWQADYELLHETSLHKFRNGEDVSQYVFKFWQLLKGEFEPYNKRKFGRLFKAGSQVEEICDAIKTQKYKAICVNDSCVDDFEACKNKLIDTFEKVFPEKSSFEL